MTAPLFLIPADGSADVATAIASHAPGDLVTVPAAVARHAFKSMRLAEGDMMDLGDGAGLRVHASVADPAQGVVRIDGIDREEPPLVRLCLIQALAKSGRDEQAIEMATEIGVDDVIPWQANRSIVQWKAGREDKAAAKWRQTLAAATEQSRRATMPHLGARVTSRQLERLVADATGAGDMVVVLHQDATDDWDGIEGQARALAAAAASGPRPGEDGHVPTIHVVVGPEGGIGEDEVAAFVAAGARAAVIGRNILRASSAGPVALTLLSRALGRY